VERVLGTQSLPIVTESDVVMVRRAVRELAETHGFDVFATAAITTATSELSRNVVTHGGGGNATIEEVEAAGKRGLRITFIDQGPGIVDVDRALSGGFSTRRSLGLGLSGSRRLVDDFDLETQSGVGTRIQITKWTRFARRTA